MRKWLLVATLLGWCSIGLAGEGVDVQVDVPVQAEEIPAPPADLPAPPAAVCKGQRWVSYEVDVPVTVMRKELHWRLEEYDIPIPSPGPQPANQVLSEPVIQSTTTTYCPTCPSTTGVNVQVDAPSQPAPPDPPRLLRCIGGRCLAPNVQGAGAKVNVNVDTRPRFRLFRRR